VGKKAVITSKEVRTDERTKIGQSIDEDIEALNTISEAELDFLLDAEEELEGGTSSTLTRPENDGMKMWDAKHVRMRELLKEAIKGTGMPRITKYLIARGCGKAFVSIAAMKADLEAAGFTTNEVTRFLAALRNSRQVGSGAFENDHMTLTAGPGSASLSDPKAPDLAITVKIAPKTPVDWIPIMEKLDWEYEMDYNMSDGVAVKHDMLMEEHELTDSKLAQLNRESDSISQDSHVVLAVVKELVALGAPRPDFISEHEDLDED
jgi:hypothetical protein